MGHKISKEQIDPGVKDHIMSFVGNKNELETSDKSDMVNAINSLIVDRVDNINNITKLANSIGNPVTASDNVDEVCDKVNGLLSTFKTNMMNSGVMVESTDKFKQLIDKIKGLTEGEGNRGIQYASGTFNNLSVANGINSTQTVNVGLDLDFTPTYVFVNATYSISNISSSPQITNNIISNLQEQSILLTFSGPTVNYYFKTLINNLSNTGFDMTFNPNQNGKLYVSLNEWYAIGVGEEDTTLRDSLASILEEEGVIVAPEDDMANLITKVDEEFDKKNNTISGLEGEIANKNNTISGLERDIKNNRDSLASILQDESVSVTTGDNLASLITKVDNEFDNKNRKIESNKINIITASKLPSTVVNNQVVLLNKSETSLPIVLTDRANAKPSTNTEINVVTVDTANDFNFNQIINNVKISYYLEAAIQKVNNKIVPLDGYLGVNNAWKQFSRNGIIFYMNGVDSENISGASSSNNNDIYTGYYINTVNSNNVLNVSTSIMAQAITAYVAYKKPYNLTDYNTLEITYSKGNFSLNYFYFGFSTSYAYDKAVNMVKYINVDTVPTDIVTKTVDISSLTGTHYFVIRGRASTSESYDLNIHSIKLY